LTEVFIVIEEIGKDGRTLGKVVVSSLQDFHGGSEGFGVAGILMKKKGGVVELRREV
jgi:hypothetical protein